MSISNNESANNNDNEFLIDQPESSVMTAGVQPISAQTTGFTFNHTMLRVKDPAKSLAFYTGVCNDCWCAAYLGSDNRLYF